jgi:hypothetical protein
VFLSPQRATRCGIAVLILVGAPAGCGGSGSTHGNGYGKKHSAAPAGTTARKSDWTAYVRLKGQPVRGVSKACQRLLSDPTVPEAMRRHVARIILIASKKAGYHLVRCGSFSQ